VKAECELLTRMIDKTTILIFDDYSGKYAEEDLYYANHKGYENNTLATPSPPTNASRPRGVKRAVDEFVGANPDWTPARLFKEEESSAAVLLNRQNPLWKYVSEQADKQSWRWLADLFMLNAIEGQK